MIIILLAAPNINKFPAIVLPAARAANSVFDAPALISIGKYRATKGTLDINWLKRTLTINIKKIEVIFRLRFFIIDWKKPDCQTLSIKMNIAAKKIRVCQSIFLITL